MYMHIGYCGRCSVTSHTITSSLDTEGNVSMLFTETLSVEMTVQRYSNYHMKLNVLRVQNGHTRTRSIPESLNGNGRLLGKC